MENLEKVSEVFSMFHDGTIVGYKQMESDVMLTVECQYLAEMISTSFEKFYLKLISLKSIELEAWNRDHTKPSMYLRGCNEAFKAELEIMSASVINDNVSVTCYQFDESVAYSGGNLDIQCTDILIYDQAFNKISLEGMAGICKRYWDNLSGGNKLIDA